MNTAVNIIDGPGLTRKPNSNNVLANLPFEDQVRIHDWLQNSSYRETITKIAAPRPEGLGLEIEYNSVRRYYTKYVRPLSALQRTMRTVHYLDQARLIVQDPIPYKIVALDELGRQACDLSRQPLKNLSDLEKLLRVFTHLDKLESTCKPLKPEVKTAYDYLPEDENPAAVTENDK